MLVSPGVEVKIVKPPSHVNSPDATVDELLPHHNHPCHSLAAASAPPEGDPSVWVLTEQAGGCFSHTKGKICVSDTPKIYFSDNPKGRG